MNWLAESQLHTGKLFLPDEPVPSPIPHQYEVICHWDDYARAGAFGMFSIQNHRFYNESTHKKVTVIFKSSRRRDRAGRFGTFAIQNHWFYNDPDYKKVYVILKSGGRRGIQKF